MQQTPAREGRPVRLYLDFDGVLHRCDPSSDTRYKRCSDGKMVFWADTHFEHVKALAKILEPFPEVEIYGHTDWRQLWQEPRPQDVVDWLGPLGPRFKRFIPGYIKGARYDVVRMDMQNDKYDGPWIAIDDMNDGFFAEPNNFIHTKSNVGLSKDDLETLKQRLASQ